MYLLRRFLNQVMLMSSKANEEAEEVVKVLKVARVGERAGLDDK